VRPSRDASPGFQAPALRDQMDRKRWDSPGKDSGRCWQAGRGVIKKAE
jgi:hypothetical protein